MNPIEKHALTRNYNMNTIEKNLIKSFNAGKNIDKEKLVCAMCYDLKTSRRTILEYLQILKGVMNFTDKAGILESKKKYV